MTACSGTSHPAASRPEPVRARLLAALPAGAAERGVYVLDPRDAKAYPGSRFDQLLPTGEGTLLVESDDGPTAMLADLPPPARTQAQTVDAGPAGRTALLTPLEGIGARLSTAPALDPRLAPLAATTAPFAWSGPLGEGVRGLVTFDGTHVTAVLTGAQAGEVRSALSGSLPGSPGKLWSQVVTDVRVSGSSPVTVAATAVDLPAPLLRELLDQLSGSTS